MDDLKLMLINRLKSKGLDPSLIPGFLKALTSLISSEPGLEPAQMHQRLQSLGWNEAAIDYHSLQIAIACLEAETRIKKDNFNETNQGSGKVQCDNKENSMQ
jgi:hypothetical protein